MIPTRRARLTVRFAAAMSVFFGPICTTFSTVFFAGSNFWFRVSFMSNKIQALGNTTLLIFRGNLLDVPKTKTRSIDNHSRSVTECVQRNTYNPQKKSRHVTLGKNSNYFVPNTYFNWIQVECANIEATHGLEVSSKQRGLNTVVTFQCTNGNSLIGASSAKCLPSGIWSNPIPACQNIVCPKNITLLATSLRPNLRVQVRYVQCS